MTVYDFDNTIYDGESGVDLFLYFLEKDPTLVTKIPWGLKILKDYKIAKLSIDDIANKYSKRVEEYGRTKIPGSRIYTRFRGSWTVRDSNS